MKVTIIRHGKTQSNIERRYAGCCTDDHLADEGRSELSPVMESKTDKRDSAMLFVSPMIRARETAEILFPGVRQTVIEELKEIDFGIFNGKSHAELDGDPVYQAWIDSQCMTPIPEGEDWESFDKRTMQGFRKALQQAALCAKEDGGCDEVYIVAHGGTVMSVMSSLIGGEYYNFYADNGCGYTIDLEVDDAGNIIAAGAYDRFCSGVRAGSSDR